MLRGLTRPFAAVARRVVCVQPTAIARHAAVPSAPRRAITTTRVANTKTTSTTATAAAGAGGGAAKAGTETPFFTPDMSTAERDRITDAVQLFDAAHKHAESGSAASRAEAIKLWMQVLTVDGNGPIGFRALLALAAVHTGTNSARVIEHTVAAVNLLTRASPPAQRQMLQLSTSQASDDTLRAAVADVVWGLRMNIGFQAIDWLWKGQFKRGSAELGFLLVLLREHFTPNHLFGVSRTDAEAVSMIVRARKAMLAVSEYMKLQSLFTESEMFAVNALESLNGLKHEDWMAEGYFQVAAIRAQAGKPHESVLAYAHKTVAVAPDHWKANVLIGEIALSSGDSGTAILHLERAIKARPPVEFIGATQFSLGTAFFQRAAMMEQAATASADTAGGADVAALTAQRAEYERLLDESIVQYQRALEEPGRSRLKPALVQSVMANLGAALMKRNRTEEAMKMLSTSAEAMNDPRSLPRLNLVFALLMKGPYDEHLEAQLKPFLGVTALTSGDVSDVDSKLVQTCLQEGAKRLLSTPEQSLKYFNAALKVMHAANTPSVVHRWHPTAEARIGLAYRELNNYPESIAHLEESLRLLDKYQSSASIASRTVSTSASPLLSNSGETTTYSGDPNCTPVGVQLAIGQTHHHYRQFAKAMHHYQMALNCTPPPTIDDQMTTLYNMATMQMMAGRNNEAEALLKQADMLKPDQKMVLTQLAQVSSVLNRPTGEAMELLNRVQELDPSFVDQYVVLANLQLRLGDCYASLAASQKSLQLDPKYQPARVHFTVGLAWIGLQKYAEARSHLELAIEMDDKLTKPIRDILANLPASSPPEGTTPFAETPLPPEVGTAAASETATTTTAAADGSTIVDVDVTTSPESNKRADK